MLIKTNLKVISDSSQISVLRADILAKKKKLQRELNLCIRITVLFCPWLALKTRQARLCQFPGTSETGFGKPCCFRRFAEFVVLVQSLVMLGDGEEEKI